MLNSAGTHPDLENSNGVPLLILAARNGHARIVSVLVTAGANVNATDPTFLNLDVAQHAATPLSDPAAGSRVQRAQVLRHFGAALDVRNALSADAAVFNWNHTDTNKNRALDILALATAADKVTLTGEDKNVIYEMSDYMLARGAKCERRRTGAGSGLATATSARRCWRRRRTAGLRRSKCARRRRRAGQRRQSNDIANSDTSISQTGDILPVAAVQGHAEAVSVLLAFGADPSGRLDNGRQVLHIVGRGADSKTAAPAQLRILRHFIGGLEAAGKAELFGGWNAGADIGRPLDALQNYGAHIPEDQISKREMQALLYERGARCVNPGVRAYCQIPVEVRLISTADLPTSGAALTVTARYYGGASFGMRLPNASALATLTRRGWAMELLTDPPQRVGCRERAHGSPATICRPWPLRC